MTSSTKKKFETLQCLIEYIENEKSQHETEDLYPFLFRGHRDSYWPLKTTLERFFESKQSDIKEYPYEDYQRILNMVKNKAKGRLKDMICKLKSNKIEYRSCIPERISGTPDIDLRLLLRHYGFPSPILDWTTSLDVSLFFAFCGTENISQEYKDHHYCGYAKIYMYHSLRGTRLKSSNPERPYISFYQLTENYLDLHRFKSQDGQFTICSREACKRDYSTLEKSEVDVYCSHVCFFNNCLEYQCPSLFHGESHRISSERHTPNQDILYELLISKDVEEEVKQRLQEKNITQEHLFKDDCSEINECLKKYADDFWKEGAWKTKNLP